MTYISKADDRQLLAGKNEGSESVEIWEVFRNRWDFPSQKITLTLEEFERIALLIYKGTSLGRHIAEWGISRIAEKCRQGGSA